MVTRFAKIDKTISLFFAYRLNGQIRSRGMAGGRDGVALWYGDAAWLQLPNKFSRLAEVQRSVNGTVDTLHLQRLERGQRSLVVETGLWNAKVMFYITQPLPVLISAWKSCVIGKISLFLTRRPLSRLGRPTGI